MTIYDLGTVAAQTTSNQELEATASEILAKYKTKSEAMRDLSRTYTTAQIAKMLNVRYQFVNNVLKEAVRKK